MKLTRRQFNKLVLTALPASGLLSSPAAKPRFQIRRRANRHYRHTAFAECLRRRMICSKYLVQLGINVVEMQAEPLEAAAGAPSFGRGPGGPPMGPPPGGQGRGGGPPRRWPAAGRSSADVARTTGRDAKTRGRLAQMAVVGFAG
ncbi:MAG: hypothetical protein U0Y68_13815 [Blastocatellia bacterium]